MPIPLLNAAGELPPGVHVATVGEVGRRFGQANARRRSLMAGLRKAIALFKAAGVPRIYVDGSFTTDKAEPNDIDGCWSVLGVNAAALDPRFWDFGTPEEAQENRQAIKDEFGLDFFMAEIIEGGSGKPFPEFFQANRDGLAKGIVQIDL
jgi:hypothetical protein